MKNKALKETNEVVTVINAEAGTIIKDCNFQQNVTINVATQPAKVKGLFGAIKMAWRLFRGEELYGRTPLWITNCFVRGEIDGYPGIPPSN